MLGIPLDLNLLSATHGGATDLKSELKLILLPFQIFNP